MIRVTVSNLAPDARRATPNSGRRPVGELSEERTIALLEQFRLLDPFENLEAEPEITLETRANKFVIRTVQQRLHLYNPRRIDEPALELSAAEIVAEVDGSAAAARTRAPFPASAESVATKAPESPTLPLAPPPPADNLLTTGHRLALTAALVALGCYLAYPALRPKPVDPAHTFAAMTDSARAEKFRTDVAGVYMTGNVPGSHGISLAADGTLKLFELNAATSPSLLQCTFEVGQAAGAVAISGTQIGGLIRPAGNGSLRYAGETYRRVE